MAIGSIIPPIYLRGILGLRALPLQATTGPFADLILNVRVACYLRVHMEGCLAYGWSDLIGILFHLNFMRYETPAELATLLLHPSDELPPCADGSACVAASSNYRTMCRSDLKRQGGQLFSRSYSGLLGKWKERFYRNFIPSQL